MWIRIFVCGLARIWGQQPRSLGPQLFCESVSKQSKEGVAQNTIGKSVSWGQRDPTGSLDFSKWGHGGCCYCLPRGRRFTILPANARWFHYLLPQPMNKRRLDFCYTIQPSWPHHCPAILLPRKGRKTLLQLEIFWPCTDAETSSKEIQDLLSRQSESSRVFNSIIVEKKSKSVAPSKYREWKELWDRVELSLARKLITRVAPPYALCLLHTHCWSRTEEVLNNIANPIYSTLGIVKYVWNWLANESISRTQTCIMHCIRALELDCTRWLRELSSLHIWLLESERGTSSNEDQAITKIIIPSTNVLSLDKQDLLHIAFG